MVYEYTVITSQLDIINKEPQILTAPRKFMFLRYFHWLTFATDFLLGPAEIVARYVHHGFFDDALSSARIFGLDLSSIFERLADRCLRLSHPSAPSLQVFCCLYE